MAQKGIREFHGKRMLGENLVKFFGKDYGYEGKVFLVDEDTDWDEAVKANPWLLTTPLVAKPDQLFGKRGKHGLLFVNKNLDEVKAWIGDRMGKATTVGKITDILTHFLVEPFVAHKEEYYVAIKSTVEGDAIFFSTKGGMDIESVWDTVVQINVGVDGNIGDIDVASKLPAELPAEKREIVGNYIKGLFKFYADFHFAYLEINPFAMSGDNVYPLDMVARLDDTAGFECGPKWGATDFPPPFGRILSDEEKYIRDLDEKTGASLKLTLLNKDGRVPAAFLVQYAQFAIQQENYAIAEDALQQLFRHSSRADDPSLIDASKID